jgi:uncharacterized protein (TIGR03437 family)
MMDAPRSARLGVLFAATLLATISSGQVIPTIPDVGPLPLELPDAQIGVPYDPPANQLLEQLGQVAASAPEISFSLTVEGSPPPGISVSGTGRISGTPTAIGVYSFRIVYRISANLGEIGSFGFRIFFDARIAVTGAAGGLAVRTPSLSFSAVQGGTVAAQRSIIIENRSAQARSISASSTSRTGAWLSASGGGTVQPFSTSAVNVSANPSGLEPGLYQESVRIEANGGTEIFDVPVSLTVTGSQRSISLSQSGFTFELQQGSPGAIRQTFEISAEGAGTLQFSSTATVTSGAGWLTVTPATGDVRAGTPVVATVQVNPAGLAAGQYHGQVEVRVDGAANSPQVVNVVVSVRPANEIVAPIVSPAGLIFVQRRGTAPPQQTISVRNVSAAPVSFTNGNGFDGPTQNWFTTRAQTRTVPPGQSVDLIVNRDLNVRMPAGVHTGDVSLRFGPNLTRRVAVILIVLPDANAVSISSLSSPAADGCTPAKLIPVFTTLGAGFAATAAWPVAIEMRVVDDCGDPMTRGGVTVSFTNGDPPLSLQPFLDGRWSGTWQPKAAAANVVLQATARSAAAPVLTGTAQIGGAAAANATTPLIKAGGILNAANRIPRLAASPGGAISIVGTALAGNPAEAGALPLPSELGGAQVLLGGKRLFLKSAAAGQIDAIVPYDVPVNASQQLVVRRGTVFSMPESLTMAAALPAIYTKDGSGSGEAAAIAVKPDGTQVPVAVDAPVAIGDELVLACTGLGRVDPPVSAGDAAPEEPRARTVNPVTLTIGGKPVEVTFAGSAPGLAGVYQVRAILTEGLDSGEKVEVVITAAGQSSLPVTIAVQPASQ